MDDYVSKPIDAKLLNHALAGIGGDQTEPSESAKANEPNAPEIATAGPSAGSEAQHQDELAELVGSLDQLVGPSGDG